jgi:hypothetical protein
MTQESSEVEISEDDEYLQKLRSIGENAKRNKKIVIDLEETQEKLFVDLRPPTIRDDQYTKIKVTFSEIKSIYQDLESSDFSKRKISAALREVILQVKLFLLIEDKYLRHKHLIDQLVQMIGHCLGKAQIEERLWQNVKFDDFG